MPETSQPLKRPSSRPNPKSNLAGDLQALRPNSAPFVGFATPGEDRITTQFAAAADLEWTKIEQLRRTPNTVVSKRCLTRNRRQLIGRDPVRRYQSCPRGDAANTVRPPRLVQFRGRYCD